MESFPGSISFLVMFTGMMAENGRLDKLDGVINSFKTIMAAYRGEVTCQVTSAKVNISDLIPFPQIVNDLYYFFSHWMQPAWKRLRPHSTDSSRKDRPCRWLLLLILLLLEVLLLSLETATLTWAWLPRCNATVHCWNRPFKQLDWAV